MPLNCAGWRFLSVIRSAASSAFAVAWKELIQELLEVLVEGHDIVFAQIVATGRARVHMLLYVT